MDPTGPPPAPDPGPALSCQGHSQHTLSSGPHPLTQMSFSLSSPTCPGRAGLPSELSHTTLHHQQPLLPTPCDCPGRHTFSSFPRLSWQLCASSTRQRGALLCSRATCAVTGATVQQQLLPPANRCTSRFCLGTQGESTGSTGGEMPAAESCLQVFHDNLWSMGCHSVQENRQPAQGGCSCGAVVEVEVMGTCHLPHLRPQ